MNYIWEILLRARAGGVPDQELFFFQAKECSPWYVQSFPCLNEDTVTWPVVEINSLYRFSAVFQELLHEMGIPSTCGSCLTPPSTSWQRRRPLWG